MASSTVFKAPTRSRYGRILKPTDKVKGLLKDTTAGVMRDLSNRLVQLEVKTRTAMRDEESATLVRSCYEKWSDMCDEFLEAEVEYSRFVLEDEVKTHSLLMQNKVQSFSVFSGDVECYLQNPPRLPARSAASLTKVLSSETIRLEKEIKKAGESLKNMSVGDRSAAATDSGTSTNKDSTRRCDEDEISLITVSRADEEDEPLLRPIRTRRFAPSSTPRDGTQADSTVPLRTPSLAPVPSASSEDTVSVLEKLAGLLAEKKDRLPQMEPEVFNGDALQYPLWSNAFDTLIERRTDLQSERLFYLGKYTSGEAKECISGFLSLFSEDAYDRARRALRARYGDKIRVAEAYRNKISTWPVVKKGDGKNLQKLADFLWQCHAAIDTVKNLASLNSAEEINKLCRVLPTYVVEKWARVVDHWYYRYDMEGDDEFPVPDEGEYPPFVEFCKLVSREARIANGPTNVTRADVKETPPKSAASGGGGFNRRARNFATSSDAAAKPPATGGGAGGKPERRVVKPFCYSCKGEHWINNCVDFLRKPSEEKRSFALYNGLCFGCLRRSHSYKECRSKDPTLLQDADGKAKSNTKPPHAAKALQVQTEDDLMNGIFYSMIVPVEVRHPGRPDVYVRTYALLDTQSDSCFLTEKLREELDAPATGVKLQLVTLGVSECVNSKTVSGLEVMGYNCPREVQLPRCYTRETIPADRRQIPRPEVVKQWPHLQEIAEQLLPYNEDVSIGLLLGYNCPAALMPLSTLHEGSEAPYAVRTALGWSVMGEFAGDREERNVARSYSTSARALTMLEFTKALDLEFTEHAQSEELVSQDDKLFMKRVEGSLTRAADQRFQMDLPFRSEDPSLPNNRHLALKRLLSLRSKMQRNEVFKQQYCRFMSDLIKSGQAEKAPRTHEDGKLNFLAHHGVQHPRKPGETRVVFDGAAECDGVSLNSALLHGPDLTGNLVGVLSRFRAERVAFMCDIKGMFLQVYVTPKHRDFLRFLWFEDNDPTKAVVEMRMNVHTFGATSSPTCANYAFQQLPALYESTYSPEVVEFLRRHFYVDDGLKSTATEDQTVEMFLRGHELCQHGGFHLCKFTCNRPAVLDRIPEELLAKNAREYQSVGGALPTETSLGLVWQMSSDSFIFLVQMVLGEFTRRSLLSTLSSVYDPLGLLAPVLLVGRLILQKLCLEALAWDAEIPDTYKTQWQAWFADLKQLTELRVPRCVREKTYGAPATVRLHSFSDASQSGYGACVYLQLIDDSGNSDVSLMMAKARVPPKRPVTMPRMELQAAVLAAKVTNFLAKELDYPVMERWYWCDSKVVLGYISNTSKKFHIYVANRAHYIRETTDPTHWNYVKSAENPADLASRGVTSSELIKSSLWWKGPDYLQSPEPITQGPEVPLDDADPEIKREARVFATEKIEPLSMIAMFAKVSNWHRLLRYIAIWRGYLFKLLDRVKNPRGHPRRGEIPPPKIQMQHMKSAERVVVRLTQQDAFSDDYDALQKLRRYPVTRSEARERKNILKQTSNLYRLDVYLGPDELIHVGGRLRRADLPIDLKHPRLLPNRHHITQLIINHYHCVAQHPGRQTNLARLRCAGFWIINGRKAVDSYTKNCVVCKRLRGRTMTQKMSDLPVERLDETAPFTNSAVDFCGPFTIKEGRVYKKRWICAFTCMASRAAHYEVSHFLTTDSFINAFRRFVARRGPVCTLKSDRGTNFVGAKNEFDAAATEFDDEKIARELLRLQCDWVVMEFNTPKASHMGGVWERVVRMARSTLSLTLAKYGERLSDEMLNTVVAEAEALTNSRPIACLDPTDPWSELPLTPSTLLTTKREISQTPPGKFVEADLYSQRYWRRVQFVVQEFWRKWRQNFLPTLQKRSKWQRPQVELQKDDVVILVDDNLPRMSWPLARVVELIPSKDGLVRKVKLATQHSQYERPVHKVIHLCTPD